MKSTVLAVSIIAVAIGCGPTVPGEGGDGDGDGNDGRCSPDLRQVLDDDGNVIATCAADEGCAEGECVPACSAAAATQSSLGCEFLVATPHFYPEYTTPCFAVFLANGWDSDARLDVRRDGVTYPVSAFGRIPVPGLHESEWPPVPAAGIPPGQVAVLFLSQSPSSNLVCPVMPAYFGDETAIYGTGRNRAWTIESSVPVTAYDMLPYGGATSYLPSAGLLHPTHTWGTNYIATLPRESQDVSIGPPWGQIIALEPTTITVTPTASLPEAPGINPAAPGETISFQLQADEVVQWALSTDMTGSVISSDRPIAFVGGNGYICYGSATSDGGGCDSAHQQVPPIASQGHRYVAAPYVSRSFQPESIAYRLVGVVDGTQLNFDPPLPGVPGSVDQGGHVDFEVTEPFVVTSQDEDHPILVAQMMAGCGVHNPVDVGLCLGDEEFVNLVPPAQFLKRYVFFTDPSYPTTDLIVTRQSVDGVFSPVTIDCLGEVEGWKPVDLAGLYQTAAVRIVDRFIGAGSCVNGPQLATSDAPFGLMVWGLAEWSSYAYPAGGNLRAINEVVVD